MVLVVAAPVAAPLGAAQPTKEMLVVLSVFPALAVVVVLVLSVGRQATRTNLVTVARA